MPIDREPPSWIDNFGSIETDIQAMEEFAATLAKEVQTGYSPHLDQVTAAMMTKLPEANEKIPELQNFLLHHREVQQQTFSNTWNFRDGTHHFAQAAKTISAEYGDTDAYAKAKVSDVNDAFAATNQPLSSTDGSEADD